MSAVPFDTSLDAAKVQDEILRRMSPGQRLAIACRMSDEARMLAEAGLRSQWPECDDRQIKLAVIRTMLGSELFAAAFPDASVESWLGLVI